MSSFQDLYEHAAADRGRAMQFLAIQDIRRKAVKEMTDAGVYQEPAEDEPYTDEERANRRAEGAYAYGLHSVLEMTKLPDQEGDEAYAIAVRDTSTKAYCVALCIQTKLEELRANGSERNSASGNPLFYVVVSNEIPDETVDPLREALDVLRVAYPAWRIQMDIRDAESKLRSAMAENLRSLIARCQQEQSQENMQEFAAALIATPLFFPAQRPEGAPAPKPGEEEHLQFGKARDKDGKGYFLAFTDRASLIKWRQFGSVELTFKDYAPLILSSKDNGMILDPYVGANLCVTREMLQSLSGQYQMFSDLMQAAMDLQNGGTIDVSEQTEGPKAYEPKKPKVNEWWKKNK